MNYKESTFYTDRIKLNHMETIDKLEDDLINNDNLHECQYFKEKLICHMPELKENKNKECKCFKFQTNK